MAPKAKRARSRNQHQVSTSSASQLGEESVSARAPLSEPSLSMTGPELTASTGSLDSTQKVKGRGKGRRKKKGVEEEEEEAKPAPPPYHGPPPDEEFLGEVLTQVGTRDNWKEEDWIEQLHLMLREGEVGIGQEVNTRNIHGFTPLAVASAAGDARIVALLLEHAADVTLASTGRAELPLHHAANYRHRVVTSLLIEPCRKQGIIDARNCTGWTPLHTCANSGDKDVFKLLMQARADLDARNPITGNEHALHVASRAANMDIIEILLAADAEVNCKDSLSRTPLHLAASMSHADCVGLLLRSRADPHHRGGPSNQTPLESVPAEHTDEAEREKVLRLLTSYSRAPPSPPRVDVRFDQRDSRAMI